MGTLQIYRIIDEEIYNFKLGFYEFYDIVMWFCFSNNNQTVVISNYNCTAWNCSSVIFHCYKVFGPNLTFCLSGIDAVGQMLPILIYWILYCHIKKPLMMKLNYSPLQNWKQCTCLSHYILNFFIWETWV